MAPRTALTHRRRRERGQAMTETMLLTWILLIVIAAMYQLFLVNQSIYASIAAVHQKVFKIGFARNCSEARSECKYTTDQAGGGQLGARVIWSTIDVPEVRIPIVGLFGNSLPADLRLSSNVRGASRGCPGRPCKRTKMGSGTYEPPFETVGNAVGGLMDFSYWGSIIGSVLDDLLRF